MGAMSWRPHLAVSPSAIRPFPPGKDASEMGLVSPKPTTAPSARLTRRTRCARNIKFSDAQTHRDSTRSSQEGHFETSSPAAKRQADEDPRLRQESCRLE